MRVLKRAIREVEEEIKTERSRWKVDLAAAPQQIDFTRNDLDLSNNELVNKGQDIDFKSSNHEAYIIDEIEQMSESDVGEDCFEGRILCLKQRVRILMLSGCGILWLFALFMLFYFYQGQSVGL